MSKKHISLLLLAVAVCLSTASDLFAQRRGQFRRNARPQTTVVSPAKTPAAVPNESKPAATSNTVSADGNWSKWQRVDSRAKSIFNKALEQGWAGSSQRPLRYRVRKDAAGYEYQFNCIVSAAGLAPGAPRPRPWTEIFIVRVDENGNAKITDTVTDGL